MTARPFRRAATLAAVILAAACTPDAPATAPEAAATELAASSDAAAHFGHNAVGDAEFGVTDGWADGEVVEFFYHKPFFCRQPPAAQSTSGCEVGAEAEVPPRGGRLPVLYVMVPLFGRPADATLQCPVAGACINHPGTLDLSRIEGALGATGLGNVPLPPHSHIVDRELAEARGGQAGWWELEVIGVTDASVWDQIVSARGLARVRELQAAGVGITGDIPTNTFLFFGVRPKK